MAGHFELHPDLPSVHEALAAAPGGAHGVVLLPGDSVDLGALLVTLQLRGIGALYVYTRRNPVLFAQLVGMLPHPPARAFANLGDTLSQLSRDASLTTLHVVNLGDTSAFAESSATLLAGDRALPTLLLRCAPPRGVQHKIGMAVASEGIAQALVANAPGRYRLHWLPPAAPESDRGRLHLYPFPTVVGQGLDETDYAELPALLRADKVDAWCNLGPALQGGVAMRALWARKALPVVGMGHSLHAARLTTEMLLMLLSGPTFAYDALIAPTQAGRRALEHALEATCAWLGERMPAPPRFAGQLPVIPYGIDLTAYTTDQAAAHRVALGWPPATGPCILFLGRLDKQEKTDLLPLLLAMRLLRHKHPTAQCLLAGADRGYADNLRSLASTLELGDRVRVLQEVSATDKVHLLGAADVCVALSDNVQETYGLTVLEAMAAGRPVVAADWNGYRELVQHGRTGMLLPTRATEACLDALHAQRLAEGLWGYGHRDLHETVAIDMGALTQTLDHLLENPTLCRNLGQAAQLYVRQHHDQHQQGRALGDLLVDLVAQAQRTAWQPPPWRPFVDDINARFAHYPSDGFLAANTPLALGPLAQSATDRRLVTECLNLASGAEERRHAALLDQVARNPGVAVGDLGDRPADRARVMRCLKVGLLQIAAPKPTLP